MLTKETLDLQRIKTITEAAALSGGEAPVTRLALCLTPPPLTGHAGVDAFLAAVLRKQSRPPDAALPQQGQCLVRGDACQPGGEAGILAETVELFHHP